MKLIKRLTDCSTDDLKITQILTIEIVPEEIIDKVSMEGFEVIGKEFFALLNKIPEEKDERIRHFSHKQVMENFGITTQTVSRWRREGKIEFEKILGRYIYKVPVEVIDEKMPNM